MGRRLGFQAVIELARVFRELGHIDRRAQLSDQAGGVPGCAAGQLLSFEQYDVAPAELGEVVGNRTADNAATDDDDIGTFRQVRHSNY